MNELKKLCLDIYAHYEIDCEITLGGNGTNPSEAANVAWEIQRICGFKIQRKDILKRQRELKKLYCIE